jgi:hypothetical protein
VSQQLTDVSEVLTASIIRAAMAMVMMIEALCTFETSAIFRENASRSNPEDSHLHTRRPEILKSSRDILQLKFYLYHLVSHCVLPAVAISSSFYLITLRVLFYATKYKLRSSLPRNFLPPFPVS